MVLNKVTTAMLFPGQAAHYIGMCRDLYKQYSCIQKTFSIASQVTNIDMPKLCFEDPNDRLRLTEFAQPAIFTAAVAVAKLIEDHTGIMPYVKAAAGHSLGEISALSFGGAFTFEDALRLVLARAKSMQRAVPVGQGSMAAIIGLEPREVQSICMQSAEDQIVVPANINAPGQIVIAGHVDAVARACRLSMQVGAKKIVPIDVSAPFHCSLMLPAAEKFAKAFDQLIIKPVRFPIYRNVDNAPHGESGEIREYLVKQLTMPVNWPGMVAALNSSGIRQFVVVCPGKVLSGLMRRIDRSLPLIMVEDSASFKELLDSFPK